MFWPVKSSKRVLNLEEKSEIGEHISKIERWDYAADNFWKIKLNISTQAINYLNWARI